MSFTRSALLRRSLRLAAFGLAAGLFSSPAAGYSAVATRAPEVELVDQAGQRFTLGAQRGHPVVLFFGYTHCPDECPTTLANLAKAVRANGVPRDVRVALITVDPDRDTALTLGRYMRLFDPRFIGLTGSAAALHSAYLAYNVQRRIVRSDAAAPKDYSVTHNSIVYFIGRNGAIEGIGQPDDALSDVVHSLNQLE